MEESLFHGNKRLIVGVSLIKKKKSHWLRQTRAKLQGNNGMGSWKQGKAPSWSALTGNAGALVSTEKLQFTTPPPKDGDFTTWQSPLPWIGLLGTDLRVPWTMTKEILPSGGYRRDVLPSLAIVSGREKVNLAEKKWGALEKWKAKQSLSWKQWDQSWFSPTLSYLWLIEKMG